MKASWGSHSSETLHAPVEMRFVDMFMTAIGGLIFITLLLTLLLPELTRKPPPPPPPTRAERKDEAGIAPSKGEVDADVWKRWLAMSLLVKGCKENEPVFYVRWEGGIRNSQTQQAVPGGMNRFDAVHLVVDRIREGAYYDLHAASHDRQYDASLAVSLITEPVAVRNYHVVSVPPGAWSAYVGLRDPRAAGDCTVQLIASGRYGRKSSGPFKLSVGQPFAWLRRVRIERNGGFGSPEPEADLEFAQELKKFSEEQSERLCKEKHICDTQDAHWALLAPRVKLDSQSEWVANRWISVRGDIVVSADNRDACANLCETHQGCVAADFGEGPKDCHRYITKFPADKVGDQQGWSLWVKGGSGRLRKEREAQTSIRWKRDHVITKDARLLSAKDDVSREGCATACDGEAQCAAVDYHKPTHTCRLYSSIPLHAPSPLVTNTPNDVGVKQRGGKP